MVMNPRTHKRGTPPDFTLPKPNPNPERMTDALWWLVCMREALEPTKSENGGTVAQKPGSHSWGSRLPDYGQGDPRTDHSIRDKFNREGPWWKQFTAAHDWTFWDAQKGDFTTIKIYTNRLLVSMRDPDDLRPDDVYFYTLGQGDNDSGVEGYNERDNETETSSDETHNWHRHDSFRRNIIGNFWAMWKALTIDMGWTYAEWLQSTKKEEPEMELSEKIGDKEYPNRTVKDVLIDLVKLRGWLNGQSKDGAITPPAPNSPLMRLYIMAKEWPEFSALIRAQLTAETTRDTAEAAAASEHYSKLLGELKGMPVGVTQALLGGDDVQTAEVLTKLLGERKGSVLAIMNQSQ